MYRIRSSMSTLIFLLLATPAATIGYVIMESDLNLYLDCIERTGCLQSQIQSLTAMADLFSTNGTLLSMYFLDFSF